MPPYRSARVAPEKRSHPEPPAGLSFTVGIATTGGGRLSSRDVVRSIRDQTVKASEFSSHWSRDKLLAQIREADQWLRQLESELREPVAKRNKLLEILPEIRRYVELSEKRMMEELSEREKIERHILGNKVFHRNQKRAFVRFLSLSDNIRRIEAVVHLCEGRIKTLRTKAFLWGIDLATASSTETATKADGFDPNKLGGKILCIAVSYKKAGQRDLGKLARILKRADKYYGSRSRWKDPVNWYQKNPKGFRNAMYKLREKAEKNGWFDRIPLDYYLSYQR